MHKNHSVMDLNIDPNNGKITAIGNVYEFKRLPIGTANYYGNTDYYRFENWWNSRAIPLSRQGFREALEKLNIKTSEELVLKCFGLSLTDQYWVKPINQSINWEDVNFFDNDFSEEMGDILFGGKPTSDKLNMFSPDNAVNGWLKKKWKIINNKRMLVKCGDGFQQQPYNEVIAFRIAELLGIDHVKYVLGYTEQARPICVCENFITRDTELVPAAHFDSILPFDSNETKYEHFCRSCEHFQIPNYKKSIDNIIVLDYIMANQDRHFGNFGAIRNADTLEFIGFSPIYDSGTSLRCDTPDPYIDVTLDIESRPFRNHHSEQIELVDDFSRFDLTKLKSIDRIVNDVFLDNYYHLFMKKERPQILCNVLKKRIEMLGNHIEKSNTLDLLPKIDSDKINLYPKI